MRRKTVRILSIQEKKILNLSVCFRCLCLSSDCCQSFSHSTQRKSTIFMWRKQSIIWFSKYTKNSRLSIGRKCSNNFRSTEMNDNVCSKRNDLILISVDGIPIDYSMKVPIGVIYPFLIYVIRDYDGNLIMIII